MSDLQLAEHYILYIDILGYKDILAKSDGQDFLNTINLVFFRTKNYVENINLVHIEYKFKAFSDNIVVATEIKHIYDRIAVLSNISFIAGGIQSLFLAKNIMCKGAITRGSLCMDEVFVFGSGLIRAHMLGECVAFYPRIIVDRLLEKDLLIYEPNLLQRIDSDGYRYIDYLNPKLYESNDMFLKALATHTMLISDAFAKYNGNSPFGFFGKDEHERIFQKYAWCREYHNRICDMTENHGMKIDTRDIRKSSDAV